MANYKSRIKPKKEKKKVWGSLKDMWTVRMKISKYGCSCMVLEGRQDSGVTGTLEVEKNGGGKKRRICMGVKSLLVGEQ